MYAAFTCQSYDAYNDQIYSKQAAIFLRSCGLPVCEITDVVITEKLIANGEVAYQILDFKAVFKRQEFVEKLEQIYRDFFTG